MVHNKNENVVSIGTNKDEDICIPFSDSRHGKPPKFLDRRGRRPSQEDKEAAATEVTTC